jgi:hypothetical protein
MPVSPLHAQVARIALGAAAGHGFAAGRRDQSAGPADVLAGMGEGLADWVVTAPDGRR